MLDSQKREFMEVMTATMELYRQPAPSTAVMLIWWQKLERFDIADVRRALSRHMDISKFPPVPADILAILGADSDLGHIGANEAWAIGLKSHDEANTVCWTAQIAEAMSAADPVLAVGDEVGARMAFMDAYKRLVAEAIATHRPAVWSMSYGECQYQRVEAEKQAVSAGLLPRPVSEVLLLEGKTDDFDKDKAEKNRERIRELMASIDPEAALAKQRERARLEKERLEAKRQEIIRQTGGSHEI